MIGILAEAIHYECYDYMVYKLEVVEEVSLEL